MRTPTHRTALTLVLGLSAATLAGCSQDVPEGVDVDQITEQVQEAAEGAGVSLDDLEGALEDANLDEQTRGQVDDAMAAASDAIDQAREAAEAQADEAGPEAEQAVEDARKALEDAGTQVDEAAENAEGPVADALAELRRQLDEVGSGLSAGTEG